MLIGIQHDKRVMTRLVVLAIQELKTHTHIRGAEIPSWEKPRSVKFNSLND